MASAPLRVLYLTPYYRPYLGGIERAIEELSHQIQQSPEVEAVGVLTTKYSFPRVAQPDWPDRETLSDGVQVFRLPGFPRWSLPIYSVPLVWFSPRRVRQYLNEFRPNVVHFVGDGWFWGHYWARILAPTVPLPTKPTAGTERSVSRGGSGFETGTGRARFVFTPSFHTLPLVRWWLAPLNAVLCQSVDDIVPLTQQEARGLRRAYLAPGRKTSIIGWGAAPPDPAILDSVAQEASPAAMRAPAHQRSGEYPDDESAATQDLTVLCVGRLGRHKAQLWLLEVYREARERFNKPVRLVLVGRDEGDASAINQYLRQHQLGGEVLITGEVSDEELARWYARADLFVLFSHYEAFGLVYFEAMAYGAPVLTHDVGSNRELLHRGAVVTPRFDQQTAISSLVELVNDDERRRSLAEDARDYAMGEFTWPAVAEKYLALYRGVRGA